MPYPLLRLVAIAVFGLLVILLLWRRGRKP